MQKRKRTNGKYYLVYSVTFALLAGIIYSVFWRNGKSFVYSQYGDGHVYFNSLVYYGRWLREIVQTLVCEHRFVIPMWDMNIGYGSDIIISFNWTTLGDPLNLLAVFFPADRTEFLYGFLAILRIYLAGLTFSAFGLYQKNEKLPVLCGSILYAFCGFALFAGVRDVFFIIPMVYFPLLLMGVDEIFLGKKPYLFISMTALAGIANFYFFYTLVIWVFIYAVYRYFMLFGKKGLKLTQIGGWLIKCISYFVLGVAMAAGLLIPIIMQLLGSERFANQHYIPVLYSFEYYWKLLVRFTTTESMESWSHLGFAPICFTAVLVLFLKKDKKWFPYKTAFIMCTLFLMLPVVGSLMNAGSYVVNRWVWAFSMLVAYIFVKIWPELFTLSKREKLLLILLDVAYVAICLSRTEYRTTQLTIMMIILLIGVLALLSGDYLEKKKAIWKYLVVGCVFLGVLANGILRYAWFGSNYVVGFVDRGQAWKLVHDNLPSRAIEEMPDSAVVRYDSIGGLEPMYNTAMNHDLNSTNFYFSLADGGVARYFDALNVNVELEQRYKGLDERTILERLAGVKYCIADDTSAIFVPYGYDKKSVVTDEYTVYENENALPIGFTYDAYMSSEEYEVLPSVKKQQALLQCGVLSQKEDSEKINRLNEITPTYTEQKLDFNLEAETGIEVLEDRIVVSNRDAVVKVRSDSPENSEIYLVWEDIIFEGIENGAQEVGSIVYTRQGASKAQILYSPGHPYNHGKDDYIINVGYTDKAENMEITLQFTEPGTYYMKEFSVVAQPMDQIEAQTAALAEDTLENIMVGTNEIRGTLSLDRTKLLCISVPYSRGWKAYVDGVETEVHCVNGIYNGVIVSPGEHEMKMIYQTPGIKAGLFLCFVGIVGLFIIMIYFRNKDKQNGQ